MNFFQARKFVEYILFSRHSAGHGIHSPFIFDIVTGLFRNKIPGDVVCCIEKIRHTLEKDTGTINVNDLGSGSARKTKVRKVSDITRRSAVTGKYGKLLYSFASEFGSPSVIELGTSLGISTMYIASACPDAGVFTIEGCSECSAIAEKSFYSAGLKNVTSINSSFDSALAEIKQKGITPGLVFIDGDHRKEPFLRYFDELISLSDENTVIIADDIYYSKDMADAWEEIKGRENVSATIDIFRMGIVFLRKEITRNNYIIRY